MSAFGCGGRVPLARRISVIPEWLRTSRGANDAARSRGLVPAGLLGSCRPRSAVDLMRRARELHTESVHTGFLAGLCGPRGFEPPESGPDARDVGERILFKPAYRGRSPASLPAQLPSPDPSAGWAVPALCTSRAGRLPLCRLHPAALRQRG